jgi:hypothetical protein
MSDDKNKKQRTQADAELEREIRKGRKFNLAEAIGRMAGPGAMKGVSPIPRMKQAAVEIEDWLRYHIPPGNSELLSVLNRGIAASELLLTNFEDPLTVLADYCQQVLDSEYRLHELVREADVEWGQMQGERPHFDREGSPPHDNDPYTIPSVRSTLTEILSQLRSSDSSGK